MDVLLLARLQFTITTVFHFLYVPLTLGLSIFVAILETIYVRTGDEKYKRLTKFWGKLFLINFAIGVATGLVQEFQFGMNWSEFSRFVGDIFGAPLAIESLLAFFLESTFLGIWIFGWEKLSKKMHLAAMWLVAIGSGLSALWILVANSFMQHPVGYVINNGRAEMVDFFALLLNGHVWVQFPHVFFTGMSTAAFLVIGISAYHIRKKSKNPEDYQTSFKFGVIFGLIGTIMVILFGHNQAQDMFNIQPMKMASAEALWDSEDPAAMSLFTIGDEKNRKDVFSIKVPYLLSILAHNSPSGEVKGINDLQKEYESTYGMGDYVPPVAISYWTFRIMIGTGFLMLFLLLIVVFPAMKNKFNFKPAFLKFLIWAISLPMIASATGWIFTEVGRQPWTVFGVLQTKNSVSPTVTQGEVLFSLIVFTLVYSILTWIEFTLLRKYAIAGTESLDDKE
jgi:cytochrome d ubiquinol oxidase subunit I